MLIYVEYEMDWELWCYLTLAGLARLIHKSKILDP